MSDTLGAWLALREPADMAARSTRLTEAVVRTLRRDRPIVVLELGTGTGSNIRYLAPRIGGSQQWLALDRSGELLALLPVRMREWGDRAGYHVTQHARTVVVRGPGFECHVDTDLRDLDTLEAPLFAGRHLVTASALLDLVSTPWLRALAGHCRDAGASALFALTYTGRSSCAPLEPEDDWVRDLLNRHQNRDKGLGGPAAGPEAAAGALEVFREAGYGADSSASPWILGDAHRELQRELIAGWAEAAREMAPEEDQAIRSWLARRYAHLDAGRSRIVVEHDDMAAWPAP